MQASLYRLMSSGPHQTNIGKRERRQIPSTTRRESGHWSMGPSGVVDQSFSRTSRAVSLPGWSRTGSSVVIRLLLTVPAAPGRNNVDTTLEKETIARAGPVGNGETSSRNP